MFKLPHSVSIYVPSTVNVNQAADSDLVSQTIDSLTIKMSAMFGGASISNITGAWQSGDNLVKEPVTVITSYATKEALAEHWPAMLSLASQLKNDMRQEAVSVTRNNAMYIV